MLTAVAVLSVTTGVFLIASVVLGLLYAREHAANDSQRAGKVKIKKGVRYSADDRNADEKGPVVTLAEGDVLLEAGKVYRAERGGTLLPGTYTALSASDATHTFKLRVGGYVRDFSHGETLVLSDGDEICAVSSNVILP